MLLKKIGCAVAAIMLLFSMSVPVLAAPKKGETEKSSESSSTVSKKETKTEKSDFKYKHLKNKTVEITGYSGKAKRIDIPESINGRRVGSIAPGAFENNKKSPALHFLKQA